MQEVDYCFKKSSTNLLNKIICIVEPLMGSNYRIAVCDLNTKHVRLTKSRCKNVMSVEGAFANFIE